MARRAGPPAEAGRGKSCSGCGRSSVVCAWRRGGVVSALPGNEVRPDVLARLLGIDRATAHSLIGLGEVRGEGLEAWAGCWAGPAPIGSAAQGARARAGTGRDRREPAARGTDASDVRPARVAAGRLHRVPSGGRVPLVGRGVLRGVHLVRVVRGGRRRGEGVSRSSARGASGRPRRWGGLRIGARLGGWPGWACPPRGRGGGCRPRRVRRRS